MALLERTGKVTVFVLTRDERRRTLLALTATIMDPHAVLGPVDPQTAICPPPRSSSFLPEASGPHQRRDAGVMDGAKARVQTVTRAKPS